MDKSTEITRETIFEICEKCNKNIANNCKLKEYGEFCMPILLLFEKLENLKIKDMEINDFYKQNYFSYAVAEYLGGKERIIAMFRLPHDAYLFWESLKKEFNEIYKEKFRLLSIFER